jgi:hypothetical protein
MANIAPKAATLASETIQADKKSASIHALDTEKRQGNLSSKLKQNQEKKSQIEA